MSNYEKYLYKLNEIWHYAAKDMMNHLNLMFYIISIKGLIDGNIVSDMIDIGDFEKIADAFKPDCSIDDINTVKNASALIEKGFGLQHGFLDIISEYNNSPDYTRIIKELISVTAELTLEDNEYQELATYILRRASNARCISVRENVLSDGVADVLKVAADVNEGDTVLDGSVGYGYGTLKYISMESNINLIGIEKNRCSAQIFALYMIISGRQFSILRDDFISMTIDIKCDRIIMDTLINGYNITDLTEHHLYLSEKWTETKSCKNYYVYCIANALEGMKDDGRTIMIVPRGFLSDKRSGIASFRKNIINRGLLKSVVALPKIHNFTSIDTALLIFEKNNREVLFMDSFSFFEKSSSHSYYFDEDGFGSIFKNEYEKEHISCKIPLDKVLETDNWNIDTFLK